MQVRLRDRLPMIPDKKNTKHKRKEKHIVAPSGITAKFWCELSWIKFTSSDTERRLVQL